MSTPLVFFGPLQLGDFKIDAESVAIEKRDSEFKASTGAARATRYYTGPSASFQCDVKVAFRRNAEGGESIKVFWKRLRAWIISMVELLPSGPQHLAFVRDPGGLEWPQDHTLINGAFPGGTALMTLDVVPADWEPGDYLLILDAVSPTTLYEVASITSINPGGPQIGLTTVNPYADNSKVYRLDWHLPSASLMGRLELPTSGPDPARWVELPLVFRGTEDPKSGGSV